MKGLELHPEALKEGEEAASWYAQRAPRVSARFVLELESILNGIVEALLRWPVYLYGARRVPLIRFPYLVVYRDDPSRILVLAIAHAKRRPGYWGRR